MKASIEIPASFLKESRSELIISPSTKKIWAIQLDLLSKIDAICRKYKLRYSVDSGTLIGAVRHGGMIPWDDDIDVILPRKDYDELMKVFPSELDGEYFLQTEQTDEFYYRAFARLRKNGTTGAFRSEMIGKKLYINYHQGIFVDIFPLDNVPDDDDERKAFFALTQRLKDRLWQLRICREAFAGRHCMPRSVPKIARIFAGAILQLIRVLFGIDLVGRAYRKFECVCKRYNDINTLCGSPVAHRPYEVLSIAEFDKLIDMKFEYITVKGFGNYDKILTEQYGDWHKHVVQVRDAMFFDVNRSYIEYLYSKK